MIKMEEKTIKPLTAKQTAEASKDYRHIVRIVNTDLEGGKPIGHALLKIKGISFMFSNAICKISKVNPRKITGSLSNEEVSKIDEIIRNPLKYEIPVWMYNRRKDYEDGTDKHLLGGDITYTVDNDIKMLKKTKAYRGLRHMLGQPVRGQKTKSNFRRNKGKVTGVKKQKVAPSKPAAK